MTWWYRTVPLRARRIPKKAVSIGTRVTCRFSERAYAPFESVYMNPGDVGIVKAVDVPYVRYGYLRDGRTATFCCVDFQIVKGGPVYRVALDYTNIIPLKEETRGGD